MATLRRDVFQAIADPARRKILALLAVRVLSISALAEHFDVSRQAVSKHLTILQEAGLLELRKDGRERYCHAKPARLREVHDWLSHFENFWNRKLDDLEDFLAKGE